MKDTSRKPSIACQLRLSGAATKSVLEAKTGDQHLLPTTMIGVSANSMLLHRMAL